MRRFAVTVLLLIVATISQATLPEGTIWARGGPESTTYQFITISPDGQRVACLGGQAIKIHNIYSGNIVQTIFPRATLFSGFYGQYLKWNADNDTVYAADYGGVCGFSATTGLPVTGTIGPVSNGTIGMDSKSWDVSTDGNVAAIVWTPGEIQLWEVSSGQLLGTVVGRKPKFSKDGGSVACYGHNGGGLRIYDVGTRSLIGSADLGDSGPTYPEFTPADQSVAGVNGNGRVVLASRFVLNQSVSGGTSTTDWSMFFRFAPDGRRLASWELGDKQIHFYDTTFNLQPVNQMIAGWPGSLSYTGDSEHILVAKGDQPYTVDPWQEFAALRVYHAAGLFPERDLSDFGYALGSAAVSPDGSRIFLGGRFSATQTGIQFWSRIYNQNGTLVKLLTNAKTQTFVRFSNDGTKLYAGEKQDFVAYDLATGSAIYSVPKYLAAFFAIDENQGYFYAIDQTYQLAKHRLTDGVQVANGSTGGINVVSLGISKDGDYLYLAAHAAGLFKYRSSDLVQVAARSFGDGTAVWAAVPSRDQKWVYIGQNTSFGRVTTDLQSYQVFEPTSSRVVGVYESPDQSYVIAQALYGNLVYRVQDGTRVGTIDMLPSTYGSDHQMFSIAGDSRHYAYAAGLDFGGLAKTSWGQLTGDADLGLWAGGSILAQVKVYKNAALADSVNGVTIAGDGAFGVCTTARGVCDLWIKPKGYLARRLAGLTIGNSGIENLAPAFYGGDIDGDNEVTILDYSYLSDYFDKFSTDSDWNTTGPNGLKPVDADIDGDNSVSILDYSILSDNFDMTGDE